MAIYEQMLRSEQNRFCIRHISRTFSAKKVLQDIELLENSKLMSIVREIVKMLRLHEEFELAAFLALHVKTSTGYRI